MHLSLNSFFEIKNSDALILSFDEIRMWSMFNRPLMLAAMLYPRGNLHFLVSEISHT